MNPWHDFPVGAHPPEIVTAVIEIPRGSRNKYELDKESGQFRLDRVLFSAVHYPGDYGLIPRTLHEDHDPLDIIVSINEPTFTGCQIDCRPLGVLKMLDRGEPDDKIIATGTPEQVARNKKSYTGQALAEFFARHGGASPQQSAAS